MPLRIKTAKYCSIAAVLVLLFVLPSCRGQKSLDIRFSGFRDIQNVVYWGGQIVVMDGNIVYLLDRDFTDKQVLGIYSYIDEIGGVLYAMREDDRVDHFAPGGLNISSDEAFQPFFAKYSSLERPFNPQCDEDGNYGFVNQQGAWIVSPLFCSIGCPSSEGLAVACGPSGRDLLVHADGTFHMLCVQQGLFSDAGFQNGLLRYSWTDTSAGPGWEHPNYTGFITADNHRLPVSRNLINGMDFTEGYAAVQSPTKLWGYIDTTGTFVIEPQYKEASQFDHGEAVVVTQEGQLIVIDTTGTQIRGPFEGYTLESNEDIFHDGLVRALKNEKIVLFDTVSGKWVSKDGGMYWNDGYWYSLTGDSGQIYLPACKKLIPGHVCSIYDTFCIIKRGDKSFLCDLQTGKKLGSATNMYGLSEGLLVAFGKGGYGYMDTNGRWIIAPQYRDSYLSQYGLAYVNNWHEIGFVANPLIYGDAWTPAEVDRAQLLGLDCHALDTAAVTYREYYELLERLFAALNTFQERRILPQGIDISEFSAFASNIGLSFDDRPIDRQYAAFYLERIAAALGISTEKYVNFYLDAEEVSAPCRKAVGYISSLGIFDISEGCLQPRNRLTEQEAEVIVLRFLEGILSEV
jgi:hypothetical protein